jgi:hypothetical protein
MIVGNLDIDPSITQLGGIGVLAVAFILIVRWMLTQFERSLQKISGTNVIQTNELRKHTSVLLTTQQIILQHDWTTTGITNGASEDERIRLIQRKQEGFERLLQEQQRILDEHVIDKEVA